MKFFIRSLSCLMTSLTVGYLVTGCVDYSEKIVLTSAPAPYHPEPPPNIKPGLTREELTQVESAVFSELLQRQLEIEGDYSAIFLQTSEEQTTLLQSKFPRHQPCIKQLWHADIRLGYSPRDKDTGRNALILSVETMDPEDGTVIAMGRWSGGNAVLGFHSYKLNKKGSDWVVISAQ